LPCPEDEFSFLIFEKCPKLVVLYRRGKNLPFCPFGWVSQKKRYHSGSNGKQQKMG